MMKKRFFRYIALTIAFLLLISATGCGESPAPATQPPAAATATAAAKTPPPTAKDDFPNKPITIVVGANAGGGLDQMTRCIAPEMSKILGVDIIVENLNGANFVLAADKVYKAPADGYTILCLSNGCNTWAATDTCPYTNRDFDMLNPTFGYLCTFFAKPGKYKDFGELLQALKAGGTTGQNTQFGGITHLPQVWLLNQIGGSATLVPGNGGKLAAIAASQGDVDWALADIAEAAQLVREGTVQALCVCQDTPVNLEGFGEIPPITNWLPELKDTYKTILGWRGYALKQGVPENRRKILYDAIQEALKTESVQKYVKTNSFVVLNVPENETNKFWEDGMRAFSWMWYDMGEGKRSPDTVGLTRP